MVLTHPKLRTLVPDWAPFAGYSVILNACAARPDRFIADRKNDPFSRTMATALDAANPDLLMRAGLLCLLPPQSYHVTVADLVHQGNAGQVRATARAAAKDMLAQARTGETSVPDFLSALDLAASHPLERKLTLRVAALEILSDRVLVLRMEAAEATDAAEMKRLEVWRTALLDRLEAATGLVASAPWRPHLSLGYFAAPDLLRNHMEGLNPLLEKIDTRMREQVISFDAASLYRFASMVDYRRLS